MERLAPDRRARGGAGVVVALGLCGVLLGAAGWATVTYNRLVGARAAAEAQWAQVEAQYQRRVDLVPALAGAVRGVLVQERDVIDAVARARDAYLASPKGSPARAQAAASLDASLGRLVAVVEASPTLRSSETVAELMDELSGTENRIAVERRRYNERVRDYNTLVLGFPTGLLARVGGFRPLPYYEASPGTSAPPAVTLPGAGR